MKFRIEDIVYYNGGYGLLYLNRKYQVLSYCTANSINIIDLETRRTYNWYVEDVFISELEYRRLKLIKLKDGIQNRRCDLLC